MNTRSTGEEGGVGWSSSQSRLPNTLPLPISEPFTESIRISLSFVNSSV